jgi:hypothetical protein
VAGSSEIFLEKGLQTYWDPFYLRKNLHERFLQGYPKIFVFNQKKIFLGGEGMLDQRREGGWSSS